MQALIVFWEAVEKVIKRPVIPECFYRGSSFYFNLRHSFLLVKNVLALHATFWTVWFKRLQRIPQILQTVRFSAVVCTVMFLLLTGSAITAAQTVIATISGKVISAETNMPLEGAILVFEGTQIGTSSKSDGTFRIETSPGNRILRVTYLGYVTKRIPVDLSPNDDRVLNFALEPTVLPGQTILVEAVQAQERQSPIAFSNMKRSEIEEKHTLLDLPVLLSELPSSIYYSESGNGLGYNYLTLRGFDQRRISVTINGVPQNDPIDHNVYWLDFNDIASSLQNVQIQRGAGSAFYGPPAIGGSVNLTTVASSFEPSVELWSGAGSYNTQRYTVIANTGLLEQHYTLYARFSKISSDGYRDQSWVNFNHYEVSVTRYDDNITTQLNIFAGPFKDHLAYYGIPKSDLMDRVKRKANPIRREEEQEAFEQPQVHLMNEIRFNDNLILNNTLFVMTSNGYFDYDGSWADTSYFRLTQANGFAASQNPSNALIRADVDNLQYGWLPRITYRNEDLEWTTGAEFRFHRSEHWGTIRMAANLPSTTLDQWRYYNFQADKDMISLYTQCYYNPLPDLTTMVSTQLAYNRYHLYKERFLNNDFSVPYVFLNPRLGLNYNIDQAYNVFGSVSYTSREPRLNNLYNAGESSGGEVPQFEINPDGMYDYTKPLVKPEQLLDIEAGFAYVSSGFHCSVNLFDMLFTNEIVNAGKLDRFGQPVTGNAERSTHKGIEIAGAMTLFDGFEVSGNVTYSANTLDRYSRYIAVDTVIVEKKLDGRTIAGFPNMLVNLRMTRRINGITASLILKYIGRQWTDNLYQTPDDRVDASAVFDAYAQIDVKEAFGYNIPLILRLDVNNIFDALYALHGEWNGTYSEFFPAAERNIFFSAKITL
jgi:iron complex outermembrane receptor protein